MGLTVLLSLAGLVPILIDKKLSPIVDKKYHPLVGLATLVIAFIQPFIGYFRPSKDHQFRPIFKLFHTFLGYSCIILAITSIFLTNELEVINRLYMKALRLMQNMILFRKNFCLTGECI